MSGEVGSATCTKLVVNMVFGTMIASLAEALSLGEKVGLQQEQILTILKLLPISSALSTTKGAGIYISIAVFPFQVCLYDSPSVTYVSSFRFSEHFPWTFTPGLPPR